MKKICEKISVLNLLTYSVIIAIILVTSFCVNAQTYPCAGTATITVTHFEGVVAPVTKTVTYGTVTNIPGEPGKCWITSNLGADHQATAVNDATEASAGWCWQFNRKQGFKHDGTYRTPNSAWITPISENSDWQTINDPCTIELGSDWRIPTFTEWNNVDVSGNWTNWNGPWNSALKMHSAGYLQSDGSMTDRGSIGLYVSSTQVNSTSSYACYFLSYNLQTTNNLNKAYGFSIRCINETVSFPSTPTVSTTTVLNITQISASSGGNVINDGGASVTARGVCWSATQSPTITDSHTADGSGIGTFTSTITGLIANMTYYVRAYATNSAGTAYGNQLTMTTFAYGVPCQGIPTFSDPRDGKTYNTVQIGSQCWMKENLNIGTRINGAQESSNNNIIEKYCYGDGESSCDVYGGLYLWNELMQYVTTEGSQGICPYGWHVPTNAEFIVLTSFLDGVSVAGGKMKETGTTHWASPNTGATNLSGFTALPGGDRDHNGTFYTGGNFGIYWSSTEISSSNAWDRHMYNYAAFTDQFNSLKAMGYSVRCIKNINNSTFTPTVTTTAVTNITQSTAVCGGNVTSDGGETVTARGVCWASTTSPTISDSHTTDGSGTGSFTSNITGLSINTTYFVRAYATNSLGTSYGTEVIFTTSQNPVLPSVSTTAVSNIGLTTANSGGNVISDGGAAVTVRGICWNITSNPTIANSYTTDGSGTGTYSSTIAGLATNTTYYVRAYATNSAGTAYGDQATFTTLMFNTTCPGVPIFTDPRDGKNYNTVQIGTQCWMKENLNTGLQISGSVGQTNNGIIEKHCYNNDESKCDVYGGLYQWAEIVQYLNGASNTTTWDPSPIGNVQGICPYGWHIPTDNEWFILTNFLGGQPVAGGKIKEAGTLHWQSPNTAATNSSNFSALPGGDRAYNNSFYRLSVEGVFWSCSVISPTNVWYWWANYGTAWFDRGSQEKISSLSVRCLKDPLNQTVTTSSVTNITQNSAISGGNVTSDGGSPILARGVCWSTSQNPTISDSHTTDGNGMGIYTSTIAGLAINTTYNVRAYATNSAGTAYGDQVTFTTLNLIHVLSPNGGESWLSGTVHPITWTANDVTNVKIEYSTNNGSTWVTIINSTPAVIGSYSWTVPNPNPVVSSVSCQVKITNTINASVFDISDANFAILNVLKHAPITYSDTIEANNNTSIVVPVLVDKFRKITGISLRLDYNPSVLTFTGFANKNQAFPSIYVNSLVVSPTLNKVIISWSDINPVTLTDGSKVVDILFTHISSATTLVWNNVSNNGQDCEYADSVGNPLFDIPSTLFYRNGEVHSPVGYQLSGLFNYNNIYFTPLDNMKILLYQNNLKIDSVITNANGNFMFSQVQNGIYTVKTSTGKPWAGVNSTDATKIQRHFVLLEPLTEPVRLLAADVNFNNVINSSDAVKVKRRFVGLDTSFARGNWSIAKPTSGADTVIINNANLAQNFYGLCVGDVNGSNIPSPGKSLTQRVEMLNDGIIEVVPGQDFELPIRVKHDLKISAISLVIPYPTDLLEVKDIQMNQGSPLFNIVGGEIRIAWSEIQPLNLKAGETLLILKLSTKDAFNGQNTIELRPTMESELADDTGEAIPLAELTSLTIKPLKPHTIDESNDLISSCKVYPNPAQDLINLEMQLKKPAEFSVYMLDGLGRVVIDIPAKRFEIGNCKLPINTKDLPSGLYSIKITFMSELTQKQYLHKVLIDK